MQREKTTLHQKFLEFFSRDELEDIVKNSAVVSDNCIIIQTQENFFELSIDIGKKLDIYCNNNSNAIERKLSKDEFLKLYKVSPLMEMHYINIDE